MNEPCFELCAVNTKQNHDSYKIDSYKKDPVYFLRNIFFFVFNVNIHTGKTIIKASYRNDYIRIGKN